jgi:hypothetical protein
MAMTRATGGAWSLELGAWSFEARTQVLVETPTQYFFLYSKSLMMISSGPNSGLRDGNSD